jgi:hypothetical protein
VLCETGAVKGCTFEAEKVDLGNRGERANCGERMARGDGGGTGAETAKRKSASEKEQNPMLCTTAGVKGGQREAENVDPGKRDERANSDERVSAADSDDGGERNADGEGEGERERGTVGEQEARAAAVSPEQTSGGRCARQCDAAKVEKMFAVRENNEFANASAVELKRQFSITTGERESGARAISAELFENTQNRRIIPVSCGRMTAPVIVRSLLKKLQKSISGGVSDIE